MVKKVENIVNSNFNCLFLENVTIFLGSFFANYLKISLTFKKRFVASAPIYNFSEDITYTQFLLQCQKVENITTFF